MAAINFPSAPANGDTHTENGVTYEYESATTSWLRVPSTWINDGAYVYYDGALNVGIGTTIPSSKLHVVGTTLLAGETDVTGDFSVDTDTFWVNVTNNRVGIGTNTPAVQLDVAGSGTSGRSIQTRSGDIFDGTDSAQIIFSYANASFDASGYAHSIRTRHNSAAAFNNAIDFWLWDQTVDTASTLGSKRVLTIDGSGRVGINTTPSVSLDISGTDAIRLPNGTTAQRPTGAAGMIRYNSTTGSFEGYTSTWGEIGGGSSSVATSDTAPVSPVDGDLWYNTTDLVLYIYYDDGTSTQWVDASGGGGIGAVAEIVDGGTGATTAAGALVNLGAAPTASPTFTGIPTAPTAALGTDTTQVATTAFVIDEIPNQLNATGTAPTYACRAWVNFNGTGTVAISASGNVTSITDNGTGSYTVNFTTAMPDADYSVTGITTNTSTFFRNIGLQGSGAAGTAPALKTVSACRISTMVDSSFSDLFDNSVSIFR